MYYEWIDAGEVNSYPWVAGRNRFAVECASLPASEAVEKYVYLSVKDVDYLLNALETMYGKLYDGVGLELGAGVGIFSARVSLRENVGEVYAVELVPEIVAKLQTKVFDEFGDPNKLHNVLGSFDEMLLPDESCDFVIEYDSLHHSFDLDKTLAEVYRVMKPGAVLVAIDRVQPNHMNDALKDRLMSFRYTREWLSNNHYDPDVDLSREMNGEHEIREREWVDALETAGFEGVEISYFTLPSLKLIYYSIVSCLPDFIKKRTRYSILSSHYPNKILKSFFTRDIKKSSRGRFTGCLAELIKKPGLIKGVVYARKPYNM